MYFWGRAPLPAHQTPYSRPNVPWWLLSCLWKLLLCLGASISPGPIFPFNAVFLALLIAPYLPPSQHRGQIALEPMLLGNERKCPFSLPVPYPAHFNTFCLKILQIHSVLVCLMGECSSWWKSNQVFLMAKKQNEFTAIGGVSPTRYLSSASRNQKYAYLSHAKYI